MNPPSALHGAMSRERKPFTYTPGGIDLSQIKSERMAKRLMRNAMDQGVPEHPTTNIRSPPPILSTTLNVPNYNCLPVQVFPTFPLPTNPKSLLKARTNAVEQKDRPLSQTEVVKPHLEGSTTNELYGAKQSFADDKKYNFPHYESRYENKNNEQYISPYEYNIAPIVHPIYGNSNNTESILPKVRTDMENNICFKDLARPLNESKYENAQIHNNVPDPGPVIINSSYEFKPLLVSSRSPEKKLLQNLDTNTETDNKQKEMKVVTQAKSENVIKEHNGDRDVQAAVTVKLPVKKSAAKTETKVEVVKKTLPDGSVEEVKTTTTKTTVDGKTEITTKTETTIIPKEDDYEEEEVVEEEEEEEEGEEQVEEQDDKIVINKESSEKLIETNQEEEIVSDQNDVEVDNEEENVSERNITTQEESSDSSVVKKVTIVQASHESSEDELEQEEQDEKQEEEQNNEEEEVPRESEQEHIESNEVHINGEAESEDEDEQGHEELDDAQNEIKEEINADEEEVKDVEIESNKDEVDETEDMEITKEEIKNAPTEDKNEEQIDQKDKYEDESKSPNNEENLEILNKKQTENNEDENGQDNEKLQDESLDHKQETKEEIVIEIQVLKPNLAPEEEQSSAASNEPKTTLQTECNIPLREPSVPLEKVEDVEIKPIGQIISKSHTENTEIITTALDKPTTGLSTQTAYNRIENIVTVNRTTKTLDHAYEEISQHSVPMVKTSFVPNLENISSLSPFSRPYQPVYPPEPQPERRHSLLLDRLSVDRQMPSTESYQNNYQLTNQNYEQNQWSQEPQSEVLTVSNVKPSTITKNQQWYQQTKKEDISYSNAAPTLNVPSQQWTQEQLQPQQQYLQSQPQVNYQTQTQYQPSYTETQDTYKTTSNTSSTYQQSSFPTYTPKPANWVNNNYISRNTATPTLNKPLIQFSSTEKENIATYSKPTHQFSSSYVPPPWEQDTQSVIPDDIKLSYYLPSTTNNVSSNVSTKWTPTPTNKFSKPKPTSYIPPAPNQSFVKPVTAMDPPKLPGRKTYYSEYERRYISVPESTYIPTENKFQAQPDPSPQYYYDNNEPTEVAEPEWRKELREFSEKTQTQGQSEPSLVKPPWEEDPKYYVPKVTTEYNPTPTWSQTLRPNTWRERSFESEFVRSKELPKTNTLGRGRPQSSYIKSNVSAPIPERPRGVSVDRYNSNTYKSPLPSEYPPVVSHTLDPSIGSKTYHNPNVPAYHSRASAEPREQSAAIPQARHWVESRVPPVQSRSFKYLQWITGTED